MARKRRVNKYQRAAAEPPRDVTRLAHGGARKQMRRGQEWLVRDIAASRSEKHYLCPDCGNEISPGQAHVVAWQAAGMFGDDAALRDRRHYHAHCWRLA